MSRRLVSRACPGLVDTHSLRARHPSLSFRCCVSNLPDGLAGASSPHTCIPYLRCPRDDRPPRRFAVPALVPAARRSPAAIGERRCANHALYATPAKPFGTLRKSGLEICASFSPQPSRPSPQPRLPVTQCHRYPTVVCETWCSCRTCEVSAPIRLTQVRPIATITGPHVSKSPPLRADTLIVFNNVQSTVECAPLGNLPPVPGPGTRYGKAVVSLPPVLPRGPYQEPHVDLRTAVWRWCHALAAYTVTEEISFLPLPFCRSLHAW